MRTFILGFLAAVVLLWLVLGISGSRIMSSADVQDEPREKPLKEYKIGWNDGMVLHFGYVVVDGHQYLMFTKGYRGGITHSPKCGCVSNNVGGVAQ